MSAAHHAGLSAETIRSRPDPDKVSERLDRWLAGDGDKTLGSLLGVFEEKGFAIAFVLLLGVSALPLPTGGATHVLEIIAALLALELAAGREQIWLPQRWCKLELAGPRTAALHHLNTHASAPGSRNVI